VLDKNQSILDIDQLGMQADNVEAYKRLLDRSYGLILVTGPTGSGKTTSLYSAINYLNSLEKNIVTIEDPVEYQLDIVNQNPVRENIGLTFAKMLKHVLRQDPDVVMVGEIRERETAEIAVQAALTGHLVLSTLHTNDAAGTITRLLDMGVEDYLVTSTLNGVAAQRLVRRLCQACRRQEPALPELIEHLGLERFAPEGPVALWHAVGCEQCNGTGYRGRTGVVELLVVDDAIRRLILRRAEAKELQRAALEGGMVSMYEDAMRKAIDGVTTVEEVLRVTRDV